MEKLNENFITAKDKNALIEDFISSQESQRNYWKKIKHLFPTYIKNPLTKWKYAYNSKKKLYNNYSKFNKDNLCKLLLTGNIEEIPKRSKHYLLKNVNTCGRPISPSVKKRHKIVSDTEVLNYCYQN